jgi:hypothetical protein
MKYKININMEGVHMKTLFVCNALTKENHVGEEYDEIVEVAWEPTQENIDKDAARIKDNIFKLAASDNEGVEVYLDAASPFAVILKNLSIILKEENGINIYLPWEKGGEPKTLEEILAGERDIIAK